MPAVHFTVAWPDGSIWQAYSPSTVIHQYLQAQQPYSVQQFMQLAEQALNAASARVESRYGYACSSAMDCLSQLQQQARHFPANGTVHIVSMR